MTEWIDVNERLPEDSGKYLVWLGGIDQVGFGKLAHIAHFYSGNGYFSFSLNSAKELGKKSCTEIDKLCVTHWMPLPEPPKGKDINVPTK